MRIITISREFGSGGRELGKCLAESLGFDYYDREIISRIAEKHDLSEEYVERVLENGTWHSYPLHTGHTLHNVPLAQTVPTYLLQEKKLVLDGIANLGRDCVIVGRNADVLLKDKKPLKLFVCAEMEAKVNRCLARADEDENLSPRQIRHYIRKIDKNRAKTADVLSGVKWGSKEFYHLIVNTTDWEIKELAPILADFARGWFEKEGT